MIYFAIFTGCLFIVALSVFICRHLKAESAKKKAQQEVVEKHLKEHQERQQYVTSSIDIIIKALASDQIEVVEASIRLKMLVDQLKPNLVENSFPVMEEVFDKTKHIPKLKEWKALDKKQRKIYSKDLISLEAKHAQAVKEEVKVLESMMAERA
jgi:hypothetical protein